jgi:hypothetical protein
MDGTFPVLEAGHCLVSPNQTEIVSKSAEILESSVATVTSSSQNTDKRPYPPAAKLPTQAAPDGIRFDFNDGARVVLPPRTVGKWRVRLRDIDTGNTLWPELTKHPSWYA